MASKICSKCTKSLDIKYFGANKRSTDGLKCWCKPCYVVYAKQYSKENKEAVANAQKRYNAKNKKKRGDYCKQYYIENRIALNEKKRIRHNKKMKTDIEYKIATNLRIRLNKAIKSNYKAGSAVRDLGCSVSKLRRFFESKFQKGMTWDNHGEWHIDHIKPLSGFNLTDRAQLLIACHYTNLQPLWAKDNLSKGGTRRGTC